MVPLDLYSQISFLRGASLLAVGVCQQSGDNMFLKSCIVRLNEEILL